MSTYSDDEIEGIIFGCEERASFGETDAGVVGRWDHAARALRQLLEERRWRPISEAPKTIEELDELYGEERAEFLIIVGRPDYPFADLPEATLCGTVAPAQWVDGKWLSPPTLDIENGGTDHGFGWVEIYNPTVWRPMPSKPICSSQNGDT